VRDELARALQASNYPVAFTGAGISAPSGIPTFDMQWRGLPVRDFLSREYFVSDPLGFFELFSHIAAWRSHEPNVAHLALARLGLPVITQNIDGLHQKAGSSCVIELHGNAAQLCCRQCGNREDSGLLLGALPEELDRLIYCRSCNSLFDVDVVLYGDPMRQWEQAVSEASRADLLLVVGSSLTTYPANQLPEIAARGGARIIMINKDCERVFAGL
jgi:NAD-dependent deacetylase